MWIFGPLDAPSTSAVTVTELRAEAVERTDSPSTSINGCRFRLVPTALSDLSISMTSPTATLCWRPPLRTTAYTPDLLSSMSYRKSATACPGLRPWRPAPITPGGVPADLEAERTPRVKITREPGWGQTAPRRVGTT